MMKITLIFKFALITITAGTVLLAPALVFADNIDAARVVEKHYLDAWTNRNEAGVEAILSERFIYIGTDGERHSKQWNLDMLRSGRLLYEAYETVAGPAFDLSEVVVSMGHLHAPGSWEGQKFTDHISYTMVWVLEEDSWRLLTEQNSRLKNTGNAAEPQ